MEKARFEMESAEGEVQDGGGIELQWGCRRRYQNVISLPFDANEKILRFLLRSSACE